MAITGSGTQTDPYLVSTKADINDAFHMIRYSPESGTMYVKLTADIDGGWDEFGEIDVHSGNNTIDFDLDSHSITNYQVTQRMFGLKRGDVFRNGKIYNLYRDNSSSNLFGDGEFEDMSLSAYIKNFKETLFVDAKFTRCAVWIKINEYNAPDGYSYKPIIEFRSSSILVPGSELLCEESDFMVLVDNVNTPVFKIFDGDGSSYVVGEDCRIQGKITSITPDEISKYPYISDDTYVSFTNSVFNYEVPEYTGTITNNSNDDRIIGAGSTGVINTTLLHSVNARYAMIGMIAVTDAEMHSVSDLNTKGFEVYYYRG